MLFLLSLRLSHTHAHTHVTTDTQQFSSDPSRQQLDPFKLIGRAAVMWAEPVSAL